MHDAAQGALRGTIGALAMSGARAFAKDLGLIAKTPPEEIADEPSGGLVERVPERWRPAAVRTLHCAVGAAGGAMYGAVPDPIRQKAWSGPIWGLAIYASYEGAVAPALGAKHPVDDAGASERAAIIADHLLYGYILSEMRRRPRY